MRNQESGIRYQESGIRNQVSGLGKESELISAGISVYRRPRCDDSPRPSARARPLIMRPISCVSPIRAWAASSATSCSRRATSSCFPVPRLSRVRSTSAGGKRESSDGSSPRQHWMELIATTSAADTRALSPRLAAAAGPRGKYGPPSRLISARPEDRGSSGFYPCSTVEHIACRRSRGEKSRKYWRTMQEL